MVYTTVQARCWRGPQVLSARGEIQEDATVWLDPEDEQELVKQRGGKKTLHIESMEKRPEARKAGWGVKNRLLICSHATLSSYLSLSFFCKCSHPQKVVSRSKMDHRDKEMW